MSLVVATGVFAASAGAPAPRVNQSSGVGLWEERNFDAGLALGVGFFEPRVGLVVGGENGAGTMVWKTDDAAGTFKAYPQDALLWTSVATAKPGRTAVVSGLFGQHYSVDEGVTWQNSLGGSGPSQSVKHIGTGPLGVHRFGVTGETILFNGVGISDNDGISFQPHEVWEVGDISARYGAFPSLETFYVSGGNFPSSPAAGQPRAAADNTTHRVHRLSERIRHSTDRATGAQALEVALTAPGDELAESKGRADEYKAAIAKSTDGGRTFTEVFRDVGKYYFNEISCFDDRTCVVVAEASAGPEAGSRILVTNDGGTSWRETFRAADPADGLMALETFPNGEAWAAGGKASLFDGGAEWWYSSDFGETWALNQRIAGGTAFSMSFPTQTSGYATLVKFIGTCGLASYMERAPAAEL